MPTKKSAHTPISIQLSPRDLERMYRNVTDPRQLAHKAALALIVGRQVDGEYWQAAVIRCVDAALDAFVAATQAESGAGRG